MLSLRSRPASATLLEVEADTAAQMEASNNARLADAAAATEAASAAAAGSDNFFAHNAPGEGHRMFGHKRSEEGMKMFAHTQSKQSHYAHYKPGTLQYRHVRHGGNMEKFVAENGFLPDKQTAREIRREAKAGGAAGANGAAAVGANGAAAGAAKAAAAAGMPIPANPRAAAAAAAIAKMTSRVAAAPANGVDPLTGAALAVQQIRPEFQNDWVVPNDIHVHVKTVAHGGEGLDNLVRIENKFDETHTGLMHSLNRLMYRISKFQEDEEAKKPWKEMQRKKRRAAALEAVRMGIKPEAAKKE